MNMFFYATIAHGEMKKILKKFKEIYNNKPEYKPRFLRYILFTRSIKNEFKWRNQALDNYENYQDDSEVLISDLHILLGYADSIKVMDRELENNQNKINEEALNLTQIQNKILRYTNNQPVSDSLLSAIQIKSVVSDFENKNSGKQILSLNAQISNLQQKINRNCNCRQYEIDRLDIRKNVIQNLIILKSGSN